MVCKPLPCSASLLDYMLGILCLAIIVGPVVFLVLLIGSFIWEEITFKSRYDLIVPRDEPPEQEINIKEVAQNQMREASQDYLERVKSISLFQRGNTKRSP